MRKLIKSAIVAVSMLVASTSLADQGTVTNEKDSGLWVCLNFFEYQKVLGALKSNNAELAGVLIMRQDTCVILKAGIEYGEIERNGDWVELVLFDDDGKPHTAYTHPAFVKEQEHEKL